MNIDLDKTGPVEKWSGQGYSSPYASHTAGAEVPGIRALQECFRVRYEYLALKYPRIALR